ncbi:MAG: PhoX family phosphatase [Alphaproteobacteria bacterium]|nr:PhoX family phosphatase [Alphaproteobacteria bacterium]
MSAQPTDFETAVTRRYFMKGAAAASTIGIIGAGAAGPASAGPAWLAFEPIAANSLDTVTVPDGFAWYPLISWGDPLWSDAPAFDHETRGTGASQERSFGDNNDGMSLFTQGGNSLLVVNNEYTNRKISHGNRASQGPETDDDVRKSKANHGVSVVEIAMTDGRWMPVLDSGFNRRITADTPMEITGPARGHDLLKTRDDPSGTRSLGTWNNCANGQTPWGTYLACEENFHGYFSSSDPDLPLTDALKRYGVKHKDRGYGWATADERFDIARHPNEPNRAGYVVEIDPFDPASTPKKRTALGRFKHENAEVVVADNGHVVAYLGDDERGEFLYRFVSAAPWSGAGDDRDALENGTIHVAEFSDDGTGRWIPLTPETTGMDSAPLIAIHTRMAASAVGATTMDRPEWVASNPHRPEVYCCLTNNKNRGKKPNAGGDPTPVGGPNPRPENLYGQIVRWRPDNGDHTAEGFSWDLFVVAGNPAVHGDARAGSANVDAANMFNSPDGLKFDDRGGLWIQTDGNYSNEGDFAGHGNNQMLHASADSGAIARFLVGPRECEVTGLCWSPDRKTMFVGLQHPGERGSSTFPGGGDTVPRSTVIAVTRLDGGPIG